MPTGIIILIIVLGVVFFVFWLVGFIFSIQAIITGLAKGIMSKIVFGVLGVFIPLLGYVAHFVGRREEKIYDQNHDKNKPNQRLAIRDLKSEKNSLELKLKIKELEDELNKKKS